MTIKELPPFPRADIQYPIESGEPTIVHKLHITSQLPTIYLIDLLNIFGGYPR